MLRIDRELMELADEGTWLFLEFVVFDSDLPVDNLLRRLAVSVGMSSFSRCCSIFSRSSLENLHMFSAAVAGSLGVVRLRADLDWVGWGRQVTGNEPVVRPSGNF